MPDPYRFAIAPSSAQTIMRRYAAMFTDGPVADLGCGRGYFLEALRDRNIVSVGIDVADAAVTRCRALGFEIQQSDAFDYLSTARGLNGIFASHLIEHMTPDVADKLLQLAYAALSPRGTIVIVTPNPRDINMMAEIFWLDATHVRPYPPELVASMLADRGFEQISSGRGNFALRRRSIPRLILGRLRFGRDFGATEVWIRGKKPR